ncbi:hypothetical protein CANARDRAFT_215449 [[Candida] arabinofermentans NRRL YB-2248]|uniref:Mannose-6-phosphate isomerase n=1 Tax=[Candida] arabinofermentans NRRL YB-2248 TaxID=983967 RepID=A0A1E4T7H4_9ASCO|nr:hypothetical protein CANARDRAFT_215449 [[Candida] arabinofermentans NRRL YB-2248]
MSSNDKLFRIVGGAQNYDWGKLGSNSTVAKFAKLNDPSLTIDESKPYAELWMGTHPSVPTIEPTSKKSLRSLISEDPSKLLGDEIIKKFNSKEELPFLFKVLSIEKVLSIQAHPDKALGAQLHKLDPKHYPDNNHKPEMAIAITDFEGFCGFKPLNEIDYLLQNIPEFRSLIGEDIVSQFHDGIILNPSDDVATNKKLLQKVFSKLMNTSDDDIIPFASGLVKRTISEPKLFGDSLCELIQRLNKQFENDIGLFCGCLMLNHCHLKSGEAMFLQAKDPHAYISGDIMECMAASDNVIRAGFTPKFKDVEVLVNNLTYSYNPVEEQKLKPDSFVRASGSGTFNLYDPPIDEFSVLQSKFDNVSGTATIKGLNGPSILIVSDGEGKIRLKGDESSTLSCSEGGIYFIAPYVDIELISEDVETPFTSYRAYCEA